MWLAPIMLIVAIAFMWVGNDTKNPVFTRKDDALFSSSHSVFYGKIDDADLVLLHHKSSENEILRDRIGSPISSRIIQHMKNLGRNNSSFLIYKHSNGKAMNEGEIQTYPIIGRRVILDLKDGSAWIHLETVLEAAKK